MKRILAPHKEQDGWVYVRVQRQGDDLRRPRPTKQPVTRLESLLAGFRTVHYTDTEPDSRIISSRRVEEAVETADYLKRCAEDELQVTYQPVNVAGYEWCVESQLLPEGFREHACYGPTLREAYYRYHAKADR